MTQVSCLYISASDFLKPSLPTVQEVRQSEHKPTKGLWQEALEGCDSLLL